MSHHIYQTKAYIIDSADIGEANKLLTLFTADLGLIFASAQSVRVMKSKLRPSIQDMSYAKVALVRGKEYWRLTSAEKLISLNDRRIPADLRRFMASILQFVKRLIAGESKHEELFEIISKLFGFILENKKYFADAVDAKKSESIINKRLHVTALIAEFRILSALGYGSDEEKFKKVSNIYEWNESLIESIAAEEIFVKELKHHIDHALQSSHL